MRSISTSVSWLTPTMETLTQKPASSTQARSPSPSATPAPGSSVAAITYSPRMLSVVPMTVCGREKRHRTASAPAARRGPGRAGRRTAARRCAPLSPGGAGSLARSASTSRERDEGRAGERARREAPGEAQRARRAAERRGEVLGLGAGSASGDAPGGGLAAGDRQRVRRASRSAVPVGRDVGGSRRLRSRRARTSSRYSCSAGNSIHALGEPAHERVRGRTGPMTIAVPPGGSTR